MIGYFDYTVWLTYGSLLSAGLGIMISLNGTGHPYLGIFFLLVCGLCDAFDGTVARTKKDRTAQQKKFGIQIDSLSDLVAFGVLPAVIGNAMIRVHPNLYERPKANATVHEGTMVAVFFAIVLLYLLMAMVRLAYFNVMEEERQATESGSRKFFQGLPVTSSALIFPTVMLLQFVTAADITPIYFAVMLVVAILFVTNIKVPKPGFKGVLALCGVGALEFAIFIAAWFIFR